MATLADLASSFAPNLTSQKGSINLLGLKPDDSLSGQNLAFQYFPDTLSDTKAINYSTKDIPGASLPIYQWVSSGARVITFTAQFTTDVDLTSSPTIPLRIKAAGLNARNVDIRSAVVWLRGLTLPQYVTASNLGVPITYAPNKVILNIPGSGIGIAGGDSGIINDDSVVCLMLQCDVTWEAFSLVDSLGRHPYSWRSPKFLSTRGSSPFLKQALRPPPLSLAASIPPTLGTLSTLLS